MRAVIALLVVFAVGVSSADEAPRYKVIVHPDNPAQSVNRSFLRDAFLKKSREWGKGEAIRPVDLSSKFSVRARFTEEVLKKTPSQLKNYWNQQIFSGKGVPPPEAESVSALVAYVLANPGAVGYVPADVDTRSAKVITVK